MTNCAQYVGGTRDVKPALGKTWSHAPAMRISLSNRTSSKGQSNRTSSKGQSNRTSSKGQSERELRILKSNGIVRLHTHTHTRTHTSMHTTHTHTHTINKHKQTVNTWNLYNSLSHFWATNTVHVGLWRFLLYCIVLYCIVLYCIVLYCIVLY